MTRNKTASKAELRREIKELRACGLRMSNVCSNLSQRGFAIDDIDREVIRDLYKQWDAIKRAEEPK